jgi:hypothetical protein
VGEHPLPSYGSVLSVNRPVRTRMLGGVGAGGEKPPATRLGALCCLSEFRPILGQSRDALHLGLIEH